MLHPFAGTWTHVGPPLPRGASLMPAGWRAESAPPQRDSPHPPPLVQPHGSPHLHALPQGPVLDCRGLLLSTSKDPKILGIPRSGQSSPPDLSHQTGSFPPSGWQPVLVLYCYVINTPPPKCSQICILGTVQLGGVRPLYMESARTRASTARMPSLLTWLASGFLYMWASP